MKNKKQSLIFCDLNSGYKSRAFIIKINNVAYLKSYNMGGGYVTWGYPLSLSVLLVDVDNHHNTSLLCADVEKSESF